MIPGIKTGEYPNNYFYYLRWSLKGKLINLYGKVKISSI